MNVTLIKLPLNLAAWKHANVQDFSNSPPIGLLSLAGAVRDEVDKIRIIDMSVGDVLNEEIVMDTDIIGIGATTRDFPRAIKALEKLKTINPKVKTVLGGYHISLCPNDVNHKIDHFVIGEGEVAFSKIVKGDARKVIQEPLIKNLDDLPFPSYDLVDISKYHLFHLTHLQDLETSRGCPFNCSFCSERKIWGGYRMKSVDRVIEEMDFFRPKVVFFSDSNFAANVRRTKQLCDGLIENGLNRGLYSCHIRVDTVAKHPELVKKMADAGFFAFWMGIESPLEKSLNAYKKGIVWEQIKEAKRVMDEYGIILIAELMIGGLKETERDIKKYTKMIRSIDPDIFNLSILTPFPGTEFFREFDDLRFVRDWEYYDATCCVFDHPNIDFKKLHRLHFETGIRLLFDPITMVRRSKKLARLYWKRFRIINEVLDVPSLMKTIFWDAPILLFWESNKYFRDINKLFSNKLKKWKNREVK